MEAELGRNWSAAVAGASSQVRHLVGYWNYNQPAHYGSYDFNPAINNDSISAYYYAPYQGYGAITTYATRQGQNWNALEASLKHPVSSSVFFTLAYTLSHNLSNYTNTGTYNVVDPNNPSRYYGNTPGLDFRHSASATLMWQIPWFKTGNLLKRQVLGGWQYSDITSLRSGVSIDPTLSVSNQGLAVRPDLVAGQKISGKKSATAWFNTSAFTKPSAGYYGNAPIGEIVGPGMIDFDMALYKDFPIFGEHKLQFRGESFNVFNHTNFNGVSAAVGKSTYGQVTSARDPRIFEVALRYGF